MNNVLSLVQAARTAPDPGPSLYSDHMLSELRALHVEMIMQLRLERLSVTGNADFLTGMIAQHEKAAEMLRSQLESRGAETGPDDLIVITGEASSETEKSLVTKLAQGVRGANSVSNQMTVKS